MVLIVNPGVASPQRLRDDIDPVISQAAANGARVRAFVLNGGSAASMTEVRFSSGAGGGDFYPSGAHSAAWSKAAAGFKAAAMGDLSPALVADEALGDLSPALVADEADEALTATGNDLAGSLHDAIATVREMPGAGPRQVVIVTGGGVQRTAQMDLIALHVSPANATALAPRSRESIPRTSRSK